MKEELGDIDKPVMDEAMLRSTLVDIPVEKRRLLMTVYDSEEMLSAIPPQISTHIQQNFADAGLLERRTVAIKHGVGGTAKPPEYKLVGGLKPLLEKVMTADGKIIPRAEPAPSTEIIDVETEQAIRGNAPHHSQWG